MSIFSSILAQGSLFFNCITIKQWAEYFEVPKTVRGGFLRADNNRGNLLVMSGLPCVTAGLFAWRCALLQTWEPPGEAAPFPPLTGTLLSAFSGRSSFFLPSWGGKRKKGWSRKEQGRKIRREKEEKAEERERTEQSESSWDCHHCLTQHLLTVFTLWNEKLAFILRRRPLGADPRPRP